MWIMLGLTACLVESLLAFGDAKGGANLIVVLTGGAGFSSGPTP
ncbi:MAG: hypothetical protein R3F62_14300 [Planctomycetota bacterium]